MLYHNENKHPAAMSEEWLAVKDHKAASQRESVCAAWRRYAANQRFKGLVQCILTWKATMNKHMTSGLGRRWMS